LQVLPNPGLATNFLHTDCGLIVKYIYKSLPFEKLYLKKLNFRKKKGPRKGEGEGREREK
jgi:hypothetical protein